MTFLVTQHPVLCRHGRSSRSVRISEGRRGEGHPLLRDVMGHRRGPLSFEQVCGTRPPHRELGRDGGFGGAPSDSYSRTTTSPEPSYARFPVSRSLPRVARTKVTSNAYPSVYVNCYAPPREHSRERLRVPEDVALVGSDDFPWADFFAPRLTVISQPSREIGAQAVRLLLDRLAEPGEPGRRPASAGCRRGFVHRDSCGCPQ